MRITACLRSVLPVALLALSAGCSRDTSPPPTPSTPPTPAAAAAADAAAEPAPAGTLQSVIDYGTGATQIRIGQRAKTQLRKIGAERDAQLHEALEATEP
jgi:hypothetical protein